MTDLVLGIGAEKYSPASASLAGLGPVLMKAICRPAIGSPHLRIPSDLCPPRCIRIEDGLATLFCRSSATPAATCAAIPAADSIGLPTRNVCRRAARTCERQGLRRQLGRQTQTDSA